MTNLSPITRHLVQYEVLVLREEFFPKYAQFSRIAISLFRKTDTWQIKKTPELHMAERTGIFKVRTMTTYERGTKRCTYRPVM